MNVEMPDGAIISDVPDGTTQEELLRRYKKLGAAPSAPEAEDPGALGAFAIGAGRVVDRALGGVEQAYRNVAAMALPQKAADVQRAKLAELEQRMQEDTAIYGGLQQHRPIATALGEAAPLIAVLPAVGSVAGAAAIGAIPGAIEYGTPEERLARAGFGAAGGAAGAGLGKLAARALQPVRAAPTATQQGAQAAAQRLGVQLRPGEVAQSKPLQWMESTLNDLPFAAGMAQKAEGARKAAINRAAASEIGQKADEITESVLASARDQIGNTFDKVLSNRSILLDNAFRNDVKNVVGPKVMQSLRDNNVESILAPFRNMPAGNIRVTGEWFQQNKTALDAAIRSAYNQQGGAGAAKALEQFEDALVAAAKRSMTPDEAAAFTAAQKQWANLRLLETGKVVEGGNVMPGRLDSALGTRYKAAYKEGKLTGALPDIGKLAQVYKPLPQSGTTPRAFYTGLASGGALFGSPMTTAAMLAAPPLVQKILQSNAGREYLTRGILSVTPKLERNLERLGFGLLGAPALSVTD